MAGFGNRGMKKLGGATTEAATSPEMSPPKATLSISIQTTSRAQGCRRGYKRKIPKGLRSKGFFKLLEQYPLVLFQGGFP